MINREQRTIKFSNGCIAVVYASGNSQYITINNKSFPFMGMSIRARQGIIDTIKRNLGFDKKVKVVEENYYCNVTVPEKNIIFEIIAKPCSEKYTHITVTCNNKEIYKGKEHITFDSLRAIQDLALTKVVEYKTKERIQAVSVRQPQANQTNVRPNNPQPSQMKPRTNNSKPQHINLVTPAVQVPNPTKKQAPPNSQVSNLPQKTTEVISKFPEDNKKSNTAYRKFGISDEDAKRGKMSITNYLIEGFTGKTPEGIKPPK